MTEAEQLKIFNAQKQHQQQQAQEKEQIHAQEEAKSHQEPAQGTKPPSNSLFPTQEEEDLFERFEPLEKKLPKILLQPVEDDTSAENASEESKQGDSVLTGTGEHKKIIEQSSKFLQDTQNKLVDSFSNCDSIQASQSFAEDFCHINTAANRQWLMDQLMSLNVNTNVLEQDKTHYKYFF